MELLVHRTILFRRVLYLLQYREPNTVILSTLQYRTLYCTVVTVQYCTIHVRATATCRNTPVQHISISHQIHPTRLCRRVRNPGIVYFTQRKAQLVPFCGILQFQQNNSTICSNEPIGVSSRIVWAQQEKLPSLLWLPLRWNRFHVRLPAICGCQKLRVGGPKIWNVPHIQSCTVLYCTVTRSAFAPPAQRASTHSKVIGWSWQLSCIFSLQTTAHVRHGALYCQQYFKRQRKREYNIYSFHRLLIDGWHTRSRLTTDTQTE